MSVDHVSDYIYVHLMKDFTTIETLLAKLAFEKLCAKANCSVKHYNADNGQFSDNETKPLSLAELVHTIKMESLKQKTAETNS